MKPPGFLDTNVVMRAGCDTVWSEDMHDGLVIDGRLRVADPFAGL